MTFVRSNIHQNQQNVLPNSYGTVTIDSTEIRLLADGLSALNYIVYLPFRWRSAYIFASFNYLRETDLNGSNSFY